MADGNYNDSLTNLVSGLGTGRDKSSSAGYVLDLVTPQQLLTAYKTSSLAQRVVNLKAEDSCREWREWQGSAAQITAIEAEEKRLGLQVKMLRARKLARLFGGAALLIGTGDNDLSKPINTNRIGKGGLRYLTVLTILDVSGAGRQDDPTKDGFGQPEYWQLRGGMRCHPSRLVRLHGQEPMYEFGMDANYGFGDSILTGGLKQVQDVDAVAANVLSLIYEAKVDVFKIPDFMANLARRGPEYATEVIRRVTLAATAKGINGALLMDKEEEYEQKNASFGGLHELMDRYMQLCAASHGYPMTRLFEMSAGGLNATGESDIRGYYDAVKVEQTLQMEPEMAVMDDCLIRSALGSRPPEVHFNWRPLWQPTARERAENADKLASAGQKLRDMDAVSPEALSKAMVNALTETGAFPGLEAAAQEFPVDADDYSETVPVVPVVPEGLTDAAPRALYVRRDVLNAAEIIAWAKAQGFKTTLPADDMHVTIAFSKAPLDWMKVGQAWESKVEVPEGGPRLMERFGEARVLLFRASDLEWRHEAIKEAGASWDHPEYQPHITISYDPASPDLADVEPYQGRIVLGPEIFQEVKEGWQAGVAEVMTDFNPSQPRGEDGKWLTGAGSGGGASASGSTSLGDFDADTGKVGGAALVTSQDFLDDDIVQSKIDAGDFDVFVSPEFEAGGEQMRVVIDGHHSLAAAVKSGNVPNFTEYTSSDHDAIAILEQGDPEGFMEAVHMGADYRNAVTGGDVW